MRGTIAEHHRIAVGTQGAPQRRRRIEQRPALLEHHGAQAISADDGAGVRRDLAGQDTQQRALAAAIGPEQAELRAGGQQQVDSFK